ncbi:hypothetical protein A9Q91_03360 [Candidatus Gracilibacteria bacterium 28_42_T64]|nr:hypothetical protein A9Q91_03360 [Candidatus Gracilibacteria bacterium 28_42_T64]
MFSLGACGGTSLTLTQLDDKSVPRGADNILTLGFKVDEASLVNAVQVHIYTESEDATGNQINEVRLYRGSRSPDNLLGSVLGISLQNGIATFENITKTGTDYLVHVSFMNTDPESGFNPVETSLVSVSALNEKGEVIYYSGDKNKDGILDKEIFSSRIVTITDSGVASLTEDIHSPVNKNIKNILAGTSGKVFSNNIEIVNEDILSSGLIYTFEGENLDLRASISSATLYLGDTPIAITDFSNIGPNTITFNFLTIPEGINNLTIGLNTETIGYQKIGHTLRNAKVTGMAFTGIIGAVSREPIADIELNNIISSKAFSVVPATINVWANATLDSSDTAEINISLNVGNNTSSSSNASVEVQISTLLFNTTGSSYDGKYELFNAFDTSNILENWPIVGVLNFDVTSLNSTLQSADFETFGIRPTNPLVDDTVNLALYSDGIKYDVLNVDNSFGLSSHIAADLPLDK